MTSLTRRRWLFASSLGALGLGTAVQAAPPLKTVTLAEGLERPWSIAFLPGEPLRMLVTERPGRLRVVDADGRLSAPIGGLPPMDNAGQGGLFDVVLDPDFAHNRLVYWNYTQAGPGGSGNAVARGRLSRDLRHVKDVRVIFRQTPFVDSDRQFGGRLAFDRTGHLFVTTGDRYTHRDAAQDLGNTIGKIVRIGRDGSIPPDNPFVGRAGTRPEIWSSGHRNVQGAAIHPVTGRLWISEHGPLGGDEINVVAAGRNYGWPVISYGRDYETEAPIGVGTHRKGMEQPLRHWEPSIAPSGIAFYTGGRVPQWSGSLFVTALAGKTLVRLTLDGEHVVAEERLLRRLDQRLRDVRVGPDGWLYLATDEDAGALLRLEVA